MLKKVIRIIIAIVVIFFLLSLWTAVGSMLFGWTNGGGAIPMMLFMGLAAFVFRAITGIGTKKETNDATVNNQNKGIEK